MDGSDRGTPNPLNPMSGSMGSTGAPKSAMPEMHTARPAHTMPEMKEAKPAPRPSNYDIVDPMMRSVANHDKPTMSSGQNTEPTMSVEETFDTLSMDDNSLDMLTQDIVTTGNGPSRAETVQTEAISTDLGNLGDTNLVAKDSIVEPAKKKGGSKKVFLVGAIIFLVVALACGIAAAVAIVLNNNEDRVSRAIEKVINGDMPTVITAQGKIETSTETADSYVATGAANTTNLVIDFNGTFDTASSMNKVSADIAMDYGNGQNIPLNIEEMRNKTGDTYFKISGLNNIMTMFGGSNLTTVTNTTSDVATNCGDSTGCSGERCTNCTSTSTSTSSILSDFSGLLEAANNNWILISSNFAGNMEDLDLFDNASTCLINAFSTLPQYSKDITAKYKANPFIKSSTENLGIAKKNDTLYRLTFDSNKLSAFANSLGNNGFVNELNACVGNTASNNGTTATMVEEIIGSFPTLYAEVDGNNNFTRFYFQINTAADNTSSATTADISLSYPKEFKLVEPTTYITMSDLLDQVMTTVLNTNTTNNDTANSNTANPAN